MNDLPLSLGQPTAPAVLVEDYHKNYYDEHQDAPYCRFVIDPKIHKLFKHYGDSLKAEYQ